MDLTQYSQSGKYLEYLQTQYMGIIDFMNTLISNMRKRNADFSKCMIIFDIDETCVVNTQSYFQGINYLKRSIPGSLSLYNILKSAGFKLAFISARDVSALSFSVDQLSSLGFRNYDYIFHIDKKKEDNSNDWKRRVRKYLSEKYKIVASIGDQVGDIDTNCEYGFMIFNPFYRV
jgi:predicted secreted acid phosphatase